MVKNKYKIYTLGCKVNQYDSNSLAKKLDTIGFSLVEKEADFAIINTCVVTQTAIRKCKQMINKAKAENSGAEIIVVGCMSKLNGSDAMHCVGTKVNKVIATEEVGEYLRQQAIGMRQAPRQARGKQGRTRYTIKVQDGCEQFCSYCIIPYTRGRLKSRQKEEVLDEIKEAIKAGYEEIVVTGIHLGLYGVDLKNNYRLADLVKDIIKLPGLGRIRLSSIEVNEVNDKLIRLIRDSKKICKHLHIPLQGGSDRILKLMNRPYDKERFRKKIRSIRKEIPNVAITTDVIIGFPGETKEEFKETIEFVKELKFSKLHVFPYSKHDKTPAAKMPGQLQRTEKLKRAKSLREVGEDLRRGYEKRVAGQEVEILIERIGDGFVEGKDEYYIDKKYEIAGSKDLIRGRLVKMKNL